MPLFTFAGWSFGPLLADVLAEARALAFVTDYDHLGDDTSARTTRMAEIVNRAISEFLEDNVALGQASLSLPLPSTGGWVRVPGVVTTQTPSSAALEGDGTAFTDDLSVGDEITLFGGDFVGEFRNGYTSDFFEVGAIADNNTLTLTTPYTKPVTQAIMYKAVTDVFNLILPPDMLGQDIIKVLFDSADESKAYLFSQIIFLEPGGRDQLPPPYKNGQFSTSHPYYCGFDELRKVLNFDPPPDSGALSCKIVYRQRPTPVTAALIAAPSTTILGEIPKRFQRVLSLRVAMDLCSTINIQRYSELRQFYMTGNPDAMGEAERAQMLISKTLASLTQGRQNEAMPDRVINYHTIFNFSPVGSRRRIFT